MQLTHLADTSAWRQLHRPDVAARLAPLLVGGGAATCAVVDLELVASSAERAEVLQERRSFTRVPVDDAAFDRALEVATLLEDPAPVAALLIAAAAEAAGLVLLHRDDDLDRIAAVTGQPVERIA